MRAILGLLALAVASSASAIKRTDDTYTECYADRGLVQSDAIEAARFLSERIVYSDGFPLATDDCVYKRHNSTIASLCNGSARNRTVTQAEVRRGMNQLFADCNEEGTFTGVHVINNLTFATYGIYGGINMRGPEGAPPPDTPGSRRRSTFLEFVDHRSVPNSLRNSKRQEDPGEPNPNDPGEVGECLVPWNGEPQEDCGLGDDVEWANDDETECGPINIGNQCQAFCEVTRRGLLGTETRAPGSFGELTPAGLGMTMTEGEETSISQGFSLSLEGIYRDILGAGLSYDWQYGRATVSSESLEAEGSDTYQARWVFFPRLVESCGVITRETYNPGDPEFAIPENCINERESADDQCVITPHRDSNGDTSVFWAVRYEEDARPVPIEEQHPSYASLCRDSDPDNDGNDECRETPNDPPTRYA